MTHVGADVPSREVRLMIQLTGVFHCIEDEIYLFGLILSVPDPNPRTLQSEN